MGNAVAAKALAGMLEADEAIQCPESLAYLNEWAKQLYGRSGVGMSGLAPLSWPTIDAWTRLTGNIPDPDDIDALFILDGIMLNPPKPDGV